MSAYGLVLAAGAGRRMGTPKALMHDSDGTSWLRRAIGTLQQAGCPQVYAVLGARAAEAHALVQDIDVHVVVAEDWAGGMGSSLRAGLAALRDTDAEAAVVMLVDLPDVSSAVVARTLEGAGPTTLRRATYDGRPGHPAVIGRAAWPEVMTSADGDRGAREFFETHPHELVECGDLAGGRDVDHPPPTLGQPEHS